MKDVISLIAAALLVEEMLADTQPPDEAAPADDEPPAKPDPQDD